MNRGDFNGKNHGILMGINGNLMDFHWDWMGINWI
jgi:hypothetical protein